MICLNAFLFHVFGFRVPTRSALEFGATRDEIVEALEFVSLSNLHEMTSMLPVLVEEIESFEKAGGAAQARWHVA